MYEPNLAVIGSHHITSHLLSRNKREREETTIYFLSTFYSVHSFVHLWLATLATRCLIFMGIIQLTISFSVQCLYLLIYFLRYFHTRWECFEFFLSFFWFWCVCVLSLFREEKWSNLFFWSWVIYIFGSFI